MYLLVAFGVTLWYIGSVEISDKRVLRHNEYTHGLISKKRASARTDAAG